jgi:hypothetical protein
MPKGERMRAILKLLAIGAGMLLALCSVSAVHGQETQKQTLKTTTGDVEFSAGKARIEMLGLKVYPGAKVQGENDPDFSLKSTVKPDLQGSVRLRAMKFESADESSKVVAFYRKEMARVGRVVECRAGKEVRAEGQGPAPKDGLSCESEGTNQPSATILKVGSKKDQRSVTIAATDTGTEFTITRLEVSREKDTL